MAEFIIPKCGMSRRELLGDRSELLDSFRANNPHFNGESLLPNRPYCISSVQQSEAMSIINRLNAMSPAELDLMLNVVDEYEELAVPLAEIYESELSGFNPGPVPFGCRPSYSGVTWAEVSLAAMGSSVNASFGRTHGFKGALRDYQNALMALHTRYRLNRGGLSDPTATGRETVLRLSPTYTLERTVRERFDVLNERFSTELSMLVDKAEAGRNRGTALSGAERGIQLARRGQVRLLRVADANQAQAVVTFSRSLKYAGRGLIAVDIGVRGCGVAGVKATGGDWRRKTFEEVVGFGGALVAGGVTGAVAKGLLPKIALGANPTGWVVLIGAIALGVGLGMGADRFGKEIGGWIWDRLPGVPQ